MLSSVRRTPVPCSCKSRAPFHSLWFPGNMIPLRDPLISLPTCTGDWDQDIILCLVACTCVYALDLLILYTVGGG